MHEAGPHFAGVRRESGGKTVIDAKADLPCAPFGLQHGPRSILFAGRVGRDPPQVGDRHTRGVPAINPFHAGAELAVMQMQDLTMPRRRSWLSKATTLEFTFVRETPSIAIVDSSALVKSQSFFDRAVMFVHAFCTHSAYFRMKSPHRSHIVSNV
jgi:hypothetical protein